MGELFEPTVLGGMTLSNRFVRSATGERLADPDGHATQNLSLLLTELARGRVGLIITGHVYVSPEGQAGPGQVGIHTDGHAAGQRAMVDAVHEAGGKICVQISHAGCRSRTVPASERIGPSAFVSKAGIECRQMTEEDIRRTVGRFADAARRAQAAGFDALQIHAAHGYLARQFLSPYFNKGTDAYGGPVGNRARFLLEAVDAMRREVGRGFPMLVKLNAQDFLEGGFTVDDMLEVACLLERAGVDAIEMSGGHDLDGVFGAFFQARRAKRGHKERPYYLDEARRFRERVRLPLMLVGGIRSFETARRIVAEGIADYISLCRPLIREPGLIARWMSGDTAKSSCVSDNGCFGPPGKGVSCTAAGDSRI